MGLNRSSNAVGVGLSCLLPWVWCIQIEICCSRGCSDSTVIVQTGRDSVLGGIQHFGWARPIATASHIQVSRQGVLLVLQIYVASSVPELTKNIQTVLIVTKFKLDLIPSIMGLWAYPSRGSALPSKCGTHICCQWIWTQTWCRWRSWLQSICACWDLLKTVSFFSITTFWNSIKT